MDVSSDHANANAKSDANVTGNHNNGVPREGARVHEKL